MYRVVCPNDQHRGKSKGGISGRKSGAFRPKSADNDIGSDVSDSEQANIKEERRKPPQRTRSGRKCRPPPYMVKDYKHIHPVDYDLEDNVNSDGGYSDFQESSDDGEKLRDVATEGEDESQLSKNFVEAPIEYGKHIIIQCITYSD